MGLTDHERPDEHKGHTVCRSAVFPVSLLSWERTEVLAAPSSERDNGLTCLSGGGGRSGGDAAHLANRRDQPALYATQQLLSVTGTEVMAPGSVR